MIKPQDWIVFLKHGVPLDELPVTPDHLDFCEHWLQRQAQKSIIKEPKPSLTDLISKLEENGGYTPCRYTRDSIRLEFGIHYYVDTKNKK